MQMQWSIDAIVREGRVCRNKCEQKMKN
jgi:hypothetical protein